MVIIWLSKHGECTHTQIHYSDGHFLCEPELAGYPTELCIPIFLRSLLTQSLNVFHRQQLRQIPCTVLSFIWSVSSLRSTCLNHLNHHQICWFQSQWFSELCAFSSGLSKKLTSIWSCSFQLHRYHVQNFHMPGSNSSQNIYSLPFSSNKDLFLTSTDKNSSGDEIANVNFCTTTTYM